MEKTAFEQTAGPHRQDGDYFLPTPPAPARVPVRIRGPRRKRYLLEHTASLYTALLFSGQLDAHLADIDQQAEELFSQLAAQMAKREGITEQLKVENQMKWMGLINNIQSCVNEIIWKKLICI